MLLAAYPRVGYVKKCVKCGEEKPLDDFYKAAGMRDGHRNDCKPCNLAAQRERYVADPESAKARVKQWQQENADRLNAYRRERRLEPAVKRAQRAGHLKRTYGITTEQYEMMVERQGGGCAICGRAPTDGSSLHVDHEHDTGRIRGCLCFRCNNALGDLGDSPDALVKAALYVSPVAKDPALLSRLEHLLPPRWPSHRAG